MASNPLSDTGLDGGNVDSAKVAGIGGLAHPASCRESKNLEELPTPLLADSTIHGQEWT